MLSDIVLILALARRQTKVVEHQEEEMSVWLIE